MNADNEIYREKGYLVLFAKWPHQSAVQVQGVECPLPAVTDFIRRGFKEGLGADVLVFETTELPNPEGQWHLYGAIVKSIQFVHHVFEKGWPG
jgi:hypothetical protein